MADSTSSRCAEGVFAFHRPVLLKPANCERVVVVHDIGREDAFEIRIDATPVEAAVFLLASKPGRTISIASKFLWDP